MHQGHSTEKLVKSEQGYEWAGTAAATRKHRRDGLILSPPKHTPVSPWEQKEGEGARVRRAMAGEGRGRSKDAHLSQMINFEHLDEIGTR